MNCGAVIVGAGRGKRFGAATPKCLIPVGGIPLIALSAWAFSRVEAIEAIVLVVPGGEEEAVRHAMKRLDVLRISGVVAGGERRQDSVLCGTEALPPGIDCVLVHDGARALVSPSTIETVLAGLRHNDVVTPAVPVADTLHEDRGGLAYAGPDRTGLIAAQTPQGFDRTVLQTAFARSSDGDITVTDEIVLVRTLLSRVPAIVEGSTGNVKITRAEDLTFYKPQLEARARLVRKGTDG